MTGPDDFIARRRLPTRRSLSTREHGTRLRYIGGCRCLPCRAANSRYECERAAARRRGESERIVDAGPARRHLFALGRRGVGYKAVAGASGVAASSLARIRSGEKTRLRAGTERRVLAVGAWARADASTVPAARTWRLVGGLLAEGYTRGRIALELGAKRPALQLGRRRVLARTALAVEKLWKRLMR